VANCLYNTCFALAHPGHEHTTQFLCLVFMHPMGGLDHLLPCWRWVLWAARLGRPCFCGLFLRHSLALCWWVLVSRLLAPYKFAFYWNKRHFCRWYSNGRFVSLRSTFSLCDVAQGIAGFICWFSRRAPLLRNAIMRNGENTHLALLLRLAINCHLVGIGFWVRVIARFQRAYY